MSDPASGPSGERIAAPGSPDRRGVPAQARPEVLGVRRSARYWTLGPPAREARAVWVVCHGYKQAAGRFLRRFEELAEAGHRVVAPEGLSRFYVQDDGGAHGPGSLVGASWMTRVDRELEIDDYVNYLDALSEAEAGSAGDRPLVALGFSQGAHTATRWAVFGSAPIDRLIVWGTDLPLDLDIAAQATRLSALGLTLVRGKADPYRSPTTEQRQITTLSNAGVSFSEVEHPAGHEMESDVLLRIAGGLTQNSPTKTISGSSE